MRKCRLWTHCCRCRKPLRIFYSKIVNCNYHSVENGLKALLLGTMHRKTVGMYERADDCKTGKIGINWWAWNKTGKNGINQWTWNTWQTSICLSNWQNVFDTSGKSTFCKHKCTSKLQFFVAPFWALSQI